MKIFKIQFSGLNKLAIIQGRLIIDHTSILLKLKEFFLLYNGIKHHHDKVFHINKVYFDN